MRQGELAALRWEDLDFGTKPTITVRRSADTRTSKVVSTTKTGQETRVGIGPRTVETLEAHRGRQRLERIAARSWYDSGTPSGRSAPHRFEDARALRPGDDPAALCSRPRRHERRRWPGHGRTVLTPRLAPTDPTRPYSGQHTR